MVKGPRYKVQTRFGWFSLDEGSYRDYLAGKLWITWEPGKKEHTPPQPLSLPPNVSKRALALRDTAAAQGLAAAIHSLGFSPQPPCADRLKEIAISELNLTVRSSNGLMRAGIHSFGKLDALIRGSGIASVRNLGAKSVSEIEQVFLEECYRRLLPYEQAEFWQVAIDEEEKRSV